MNVLLIAVNAKFSHTNPAVRSLAAYLNAHGHHADFLEFTINMDLAMLIRTIAQRGREVEPQLVLFSAYIWNIEEIKAMVSDLKKIRPHWPIGIGGPEVSFDGTVLLESEIPSADLILCGEGESLALEVADRLQGNSGDVTAMDGILGLAYRKDFETVVWNGKRPLMTELGQLPFVYGFEEDLKHRIIYYESSRGCPFNCSYCLSSTLDGVRYLPLERVCKDLKVFLEAKAMQVKFVDRTFNADRERSLAIMKFIAENDNGFTNFHFEVTASMLDEATMNFVESVRPSLFQFEIGVQTTYTQTGMSINRNMSFESIKSNCQRMLAAGNVHLHLDLIAGLPYETYERFKQSMDDVMAIRPHMLQLGFLKLLKGSKIRNEATLHGYRFTDRAPYEVLFNNYISYDQMTMLKQMEELLEQYFNSGMLRQATLLTAERFFEGSYAAFLEDFAQYWTEYGLFLKNHKKEGLIGIFVEYLKQRVLPESKAVGLDERSERIIEVAWFEGLRSGIRSLGEKLQPESLQYKDLIHQYFKQDDRVASFNSAWVGKPARDLVKHVVVVQVHTDMQRLFESEVLEDGNASETRIYAFDYSARDPVTGYHYFHQIERE